MAHTANPRSQELFAEPDTPAPKRNGDLHVVLHQVFGHRNFRPHQQPVCEAAAAGRDVLLVMPTGAGKSLCYQLPAIARGGTALVISPLIALMDDQAHKLAELKLRVARIHSGLPRDDLREAARAYLEGRLDFLFIAPERLRVPGFPEMLARRKPALVAIDEAHCISQWGHDFRPDYRTLGQFLPALRPAPLIALTATATPAVQQDILRALSLRDPAVFITGFRRSNLHIEVVEASKPQRLDLMRKLLAPASARPAIVYAQSRKAAEEIAGSFGTLFSSAAYHAGLDPATRDRVQRNFLSGQLDVVVATVAFGMGVDKANVRTVIHAALPGSVEAYYQEIGRAGRDGEPSRAILLHNFADRRTQEFLLEKNYPPIPEIERVLQALGDTPSTLAELQQQLKMERETVERCIDKLLIPGAVAADLDGTVHATRQAHWKQSYDQQLQYRRAQIDKIVAFAEGTSCRMAALIRHFGDLTDGGAPCGHCDICRPQGASATAGHPPDAAERDSIHTLLKSLANGPRSAGKIFTDLGWDDRKFFDSLTDALSRAGLLTITSDSFRTEDGRDVTYRKLALTPEGRDVNDDGLSTVWLRDSLNSPPATKRQSSSPSRNDTSRQTAESPLTANQLDLEKKLKQWRLAISKARGVPPFTVFHDSVLRSIAQICPADTRDLEKIRGIGQDKLNRYAADLLALCNGREACPPEPSKQNEPKFQSQLPTPARSNSAPPPGFHEKRLQISAHTHKPPLERKPAQPLTPFQQELEARLRGWRSDQATASGLPSFFVLSDTALKEVAVNQPQTFAELSTISGLGPDKLQRYGQDLIELCRA